MTGLATVHGGAGLERVRLLPQGPPVTRVARSDLDRRQAVQHYRTGLELLGAEQFEKAEREFLMAIELDSLFTLARYGLGQSYMAQRRYASAIVAFNGCRDAYQEIANLRQQDAFNADRLIIDEIQELRESISRVRSGQIRNVGPATLQRLESRLDDLERMRGTDVAHRSYVPAEVLLALGSAYFRNQQIDDAEREWKAATAVNPSLGEAHNNLAALYAMTGRKSEAEVAIRAAERAGYRVNPRLKTDVRNLP